MSDTQKIRSIDFGPVVVIDFFTTPFPKCYGAALVVVMLLFTLDHYFTIICVLIGLWGKTAVSY